MAKKKTGRPSLGDHKKITLRIYNKKYPGLKNELDRVSKSSLTLNDFILNLVNNYFKEKSERLKSFESEKVIRDFLNDLTIKIGEMQDILENFKLVLDLV